VISEGLQSGDLDGRQHGLLLHEKVDRIFPIAQARG
jgi:hypothetical protein